MRIRTGVRHAKEAGVSVLQLRGSGKGVAARTVKQSVVPAVRTAAWLSPPLHCVRSHFECFVREGAAVQRLPALDRASLQMSGKTRAVRHCVGALRSTSVQRHEAAVRVTSWN